MPGYQTTQQCIDIPGAASLHIRSLLDRQQFADPGGTAEARGVSSAAWPLFGLLWPSSLQLASWMAARPLRAGERILEVGCGLALASLVAHRDGADVTASDCHPLAADFLRRNVALNGLPPLPYGHGLWGADDPLARHAPVAQGEPLVAGLFDLIIGSDVLYERDDDGQLCGFIQRHALPAAEVLIVDPNRGNRSAFSKRMALAGFSLQETALGAAAADAPAYRGRLLHYTRAATDRA